MWLTNTRVLIRKKKNLTSKLKCPQKVKSISYSVYYCFDFKIKTKMTVKEKLSTFDFHAFYYFTK